MATGRRWPQRSTKTVSKFFTLPGPPHSSLRMASMTRRASSIEEYSFVTFSPRISAAEYPKILLRPVVVEHDGAGAVDGDDDIGRAFDQLFEVVRREREPQMRRAPI